MITVKRPRLLDSNLKETAALYPLGLQINLQTPGVSTATLTLSPNDAEPGMHDWIEIYNQNGSVGVYRVTNPVTDFNQQLTLTLRHGIDCLADSVLESQEDYKGAPAALLTRLLNAQKTLVNGVKPWTLGTCAATDDIEVNINYPRLSELLNNIEEQLEGYLIVYDPYVELYHYESKTRGAENTKEKVQRFQTEIEYMRSHWITILKDGDPYYNKNLSLSKWNYALRYKG